MLWYSWTETAVLEESLFLWTFQLPSSVYPGQSVTVVVCYSIKRETANVTITRRMERPADDIFLLNDLGPMQSPVSRHLFLGHSSATPTSSSFGSNNNTVKTAVKTVSPKPKPTVNNENVFGNSASPLVPMKRKRGRPPKNKSLVVEEQDVLPTAPSPPVVPPASTIVTNSNSTVSSNTPTNNINSPKIITLTDWSLATVPNSAKLTGVPVEVRSLWVVLVGRRADMVEAWHSSIVTERILGNHIKTGSGRSLYILESPMNIIEMQANGTSSLSLY